MDPKLIVIVAGLFVALAGYVFLAPDQFGFLRLPDGFAGLGMERIVTGLALMLLGFIGALNEIQGEHRRRKPRPFAFGGEPAPAGPQAPARQGPLMLDIEPAPAPAVPERDIQPPVDRSGTPIRRRRSLRIKRP